MDPSNEYCANKQQGLKPPQETTCLFRSETEKNYPANKQTNTQFSYQQHRDGWVEKVTFTPTSSCTTSHFKIQIQWRIPLERLRDIYRETLSQQWFKNLPRL